MPDDEAQTRPGGLGRTTRPTTDRAHPPVPNCRVRRARPVNLTPPPRRDRRRPVASAARSLVRFVNSPPSPTARSPRRVR